MANDAADWSRWSVQIPAKLLWRLKIRAAEDREALRDTLRKALEAYLGPET